MIGVLHCNYSERGGQVSKMVVGFEVLTLIIMNVAILMGYHLHLLGRKSAEQEMLVHIWDTQCYIPGDGNIQAKFLSPSCFLTLFKILALICNSD
jgi:hypothetical protein